MDGANFNFYQFYLRYLSFIAALSFFIIHHELEEFHLLLLYL